MIRFVDTRSAMIGARFAFYDTISDKFMDFGGNQTFDDWAEFEEWQPEGELRERCRCLCPDWAFISGEPA